MITFANNPLDRTAVRRDDGEWIAAQLAAPSTRVLALQDGKPLVRDERLAFVNAPASEPLLFLGVDDSGAAYFACETTADDGEFRELRAAALTLPADEVAIVAVAKSLFYWHERHGFCANCGSRTNVTSAGWKRVCPACSAEHFPRVDPVVIMLPLQGDRCLLGRQSTWPAGRMAPLAGFVEPGETIEEACAREVAEEAQLRATRVAYHACQPWPFPSSLMFGLFVEVEGEGVADQVELEEVRWLTRDEVRAMLEGGHPEVLPPNKYAIAHELLTYWTAVGGSVFKQPISS
ncbi:MAG TPA: NAD(+) diphosphatase [Thermoanaerobaculia bacterium]|nr:NAD(+) diphosphatase [Thermoanaerobaculia bacterium]